MHFIVFELANRSKWYSRAEHWILFYFVLSIFLLYHMKTYRISYVHSFWYYTWYTIFKYIYHNVMLYQIEFCYMILCFICFIPLYYTQYFICHIPYKKTQYAIYNRQTVYYLRHTIYNLQHTCMQNKCAYQHIHPWNLTWNLRIHPWKRKIIFQTIIFKFYVKPWGCININKSTSHRYTNVHLWWCVHL